MDKLLRSNTFVKIMSVAFAVLLYIAVSDSPIGFQPANQEGATVIRNVVLDAELNEQQYAVVDMPQTVNLTLSGNTFLLNRIVADNYRAFVDLTAYEAGVHRNVPVKVEGLPEGVDYVTDPSNVRVVIEEKQQKEMPVEVETVGQPKEGYTPGVPTVTPEKVLVRAGEHRLKDVALVKAIVNISDADDDVTQSVEVKAYNEAAEVLEDVEIDQPTAEVEVPITSPSTEVPIRSRIEELPPNGFSVNNIRLDREHITVYGDKSVIDTLDAYPGPMLDLSNVTKDRTFEGKIPLIKGVTRVDPEVIEIEVDIVPAERKKIEDLTVDVHGLPDGWTLEFASAEDSTISVTLEGAANRMKETTRRHVVPYIDVADLEPGKHKVDINWDLPLYIKPVAWKESVDITLKSGS